MDEPEAEGKEEEGVAKIRRVFLGKGEIEVEKDEKYRALLEFLRERGIVLLDRHG